MASIAELVGTMVSAAQRSVGDDWPKIRAYAKPEFEQLARSMLSIGRLVAAGEVTPTQAKALLRIHRNTTLTVFLAVEGMGIIAVENAINSALSAVKETVNGAVGFALV